MLVCCERCLSYNSCIRKWMLAERELDTTCCYECEHFEDCLSKETKRRWIFLGHINGGEF